MLCYTGIAVLLTMMGVAVLAKGFYIMTVERSYWNAVDSLVKVDSIKVDPTRGNILSSNGQQLACNLPEYKIFMDFNALRDGKADTLWHDSLGNVTPTLRKLCASLHEIFPEKSSEEFLEHLEKGYNKRSKYWLIVKRRIDYTTYNRVKALPIFRLRPGVGGFAAEKFMVRNRPYGSLASSIIGDTYKEKGIAYSGLELAFDTVLKGSPGFKHRRKVLNGWVDMLDSAATNGNDIVTTIDVGIQDLAERSLINELRKVNAYTGVAIVMEVETGNIKAMVNMDLDPETGQYREGRNHAIADLLEPGSVFKTASIMVALEDGFIPDTANCYVDTQGGIVEMYGSKMRDHNWHRGGYGRINVSRILQVSSNIGVSQIINKHYSKNPDKFVRGIHKLGLATDLKLPFPEYSAPRIRIPQKDKRGKYTSAILTLPGGREVKRSWSNTALPWMSIGYETQVPPISTLTLYNAIANGGKMVRPRFVTRIEREGQTIQEFPVEVIKEKICSDYTLGTIQDILYKVVHVGLGKTAGSPNFHVSGKTGTAQKAHNGSYKNGVMDYLLSFCGYFPSGLDADGRPNKPKYSCIVCIQKSGLPASGGLMSGQVFHDIAEGIMAQNIKYGVKSARDSTSIPYPDVKAGNVLAADYVLKHLGFNVSGGWQGNKGDGMPVWGRVDRKASEMFIQKTATVSKNQMPDVLGMGARDAVYLIESRGAKVILKGSGKVKHQSKPIGAPIHKNEKITLELG